MSQVVRLQLLMRRSSPVITLQSSLSLFRFDPIIYAVPRPGYNPPGQFQVTQTSEEEVVDNVYIKGETSEPASLLRADH